MPTLEDAITLALAVHGGKVDKGGEPYILHPLRVMLSVKPEARIAAVLHDAVEDGDSTTMGDLLDLGYSYEDLHAIESLTRRESEVYGEYIRRVHRNSKARIIKYADLLDNLLPERSGNIPESLRMRYRLALTQMYELDKEKI